MTPMKVSPTLSISTAVALAFSVTNVNAAQISRSQVVEHYADVAHAVYEDSLISAKTLNHSIAAFLANPSEAAFKQAKADWFAARVPYQQSEVFRFGNAIVDDWEGQLNAWPLDEGLIDYVANDYQHELGNQGANANIIANTTLTIGSTTIDAKNITPELIADLNEIGGSEANVASGYHAIEFLLWGQDLNGTNPGAGNRAYTDYLAGDQCTNGNCERRGQYLQATAQLLVQDLEWMEQQWSAQQSDNYRQTLVNDSADNGLRKMLFGMGSLSLGELAGERMKVALEANSTEDEHDCFSDNTHNSHFYNAQGVYNVFTGNYARINGDVITGPSIKDLVAENNPTVANEIQGQFDTTLKQVHRLVDSAEKNNVYFDQLIAANNSEGHKVVNMAISALVKQTAAIEQVAAILTIDNLNPDTADHEF
jgi:putative iron-regulated protein